MSTAAQQPPVSRPALRFAVGVLVSLGLLAALFIYLDIRPKDVWQALRTASPVGIAAVIAVHLFALIAKVRRWRLLLRGSGCELPQLEAGTDPALRHLVQDAVFLGWLGNLVLPANSGEMVRPLLFSQRARMPFARILGTVVLERSVDLLIIAAVFWAAFAFLSVPESLPAEVIATSQFAGIAALALLAGLAILWKLGPPESSAQEAQPTPPAGARLRDLLARFRSGLAGFQQPSLLLGVFAWTAISWLLEIVGAWLCLLVFKVKLTAAWTAATEHVVATTLAVSLVPVPGGVGVEQPVTLAVFEPFGEGVLAADTVIAVSLVLTLASIFWVVPLGLLGMWRQGARLRT